jgi:hypothetical protein
MFQLSWSSATTRRIQLHAHHVRSLLLVSFGRGARLGRLRVGPATRCELVMEEREREGSLLEQNSHAAIS